MLPSKLVRAMMLQVLYSVRSERQLVEQINYNLLFRWFVGLSIEDAVWNHSVFSKNRERMIDNDIAIDLFNATVDMASFLGHVTTDNRHGLVVNAQTTKATGTAERDAAAEMLGELAVREKHITVGADKAYDTRGFVQACRAVDGRTTRHVGYEISQRKRKCIEQCFGWAKVVGRMRQVMVRGLDKVNQAFTLTMAAYNITRLRNLDALGA